MDRNGPRTVVRLTRAAFDKLPEYSTSLPSGIRVGKQFKAKRPWRSPDFQWWRGTYGRPDGSGPEGTLPIWWDRIEVAEDGTAPEHITSSDDWSRLPTPEDEVPEFERASGACTCDVCGSPYRRHPVSGAWWWLTELCDGSLVKL
jgi:hypothetical protein